MTPPRAPSHKKSAALSWHRARELALAQPDALQRDHFGSLAFHLRGKTFAQLSAEENPERRALLKLALADQAALLMSDPQTFSAAPHWGAYGWTYVRLDGIDAVLFDDLLHKAWREVAPKVRAVSAKRKP